MPNHFWLHPHLKVQPFRHEMCSTFVWPLPVFLPALTWQQFLLILCICTSPKTLLLSIPVPAMKCHCLKKRQMLQMPRRSICDSLPAKQPSPHKSYFPEKTMLAIFSNPIHCWYCFPCTFERIWCLVTFAPGFCGQYTSTDGAEIAFSSEQLLFLREQNQFSLTMPRDKAVAQVEHLPLTTNLCFWGFLAFPTFFKLYWNSCVWHVHIQVYVHLEFKMYHNLLGSSFPESFQHILMTLHNHS